MFWNHLSLSGQGRPFRLLTAAKTSRDAAREADKAVAAAIEGGILLTSLRRSQSPSPQSPRTLPRTSVRLGPCPSQQILCVRRGPQGPDPPAGKGPQGPEKGGLREPGTGRGSRGSRAFCLETSSEKTENERPCRLTVRVDSHGVSREEATSEWSDVETVRTTSTGVEPIAQACQGGGLTPHGDSGTLVSSSTTRP